MTGAELQKRLDAEGLPLKPGEIDRVLAVARYLRDAVARARAALGTAP